MHLNTALLLIDHVLRIFSLFERTIFQTREGSHVSKSSPWLAYVALCFASFLWAGSFSAMKIALSGYSPMFVVFARMLLAFLLLAPFSKNIFRSCQPKLSDIKFLLLMVLGEPCLYFVFEANALRFTSSAHSGMVTATLPLFVSLGAMFFLKERLPRHAFVGLLLAAGGVVWLSLGGIPTSNSPRPAFGNMLELCAMLCTVSYILNSRHLSLRYSPLALTFAMTFAGSLFFFPLLFLPGYSFPTTFPLRPTLAIVFLSLFATVCAFFCYNFGIKKTSASRASTFINLIPVLTVAMGWLILDEKFTLEQCCASAFVLLGVWLSQKKSSSQKETQTT